MRKFLLAAALLASTAVAANAATIGSLGINPNSTSGAFQSLPTGTGGTGTGLFTDRFDFSLVGGPAFLTIASATNVYAKASDFITNFEGSVWFTNNTATTADDIAVIGPVAATACPIVPNCQGFAGSTLLTLVGDYYLQLTGSGGGTSGYGGNLAVAEVPIPGGLALFATGLVGLGLLRRRRNAAA